MGLAHGPSGLAPQPDPPTLAHSGSHHHALEPLRPFAPIRSAAGEIPFSPSVIVGPPMGRGPDPESPAPGSGLNRVRP
jgi:hypothetical protein